MSRYSNCSYSRIMFQFARRGQVWMLLFYLAIRFSQFIGISRQCEPTRGQTYVELNYPLCTAPMFISLLDSRGIRAADSRASVDMKKMQITCLIGRMAKTVNYQHGLAYSNSKLTPRCNNAISLIKLYR